MDDLVITNWIISKMLIVSTRLRISSFKKNLLGIHAPDLIRFAVK